MTNNFTFHKFFLQLVWLLRPMTFRNQYNSLHQLARFIICLKFIFGSDFTTTNYYS